MLLYRAQNDSSPARLWCGLIVGDLDRGGRLHTGALFPWVGWCLASSQHPRSPKAPQSKNLVCPLQQSTLPAFSRDGAPIIWLEGLLGSLPALSLALGSIPLHTEPCEWWGYLSHLSRSTEKLVGVGLYPMSSQATLMVQDSLVQSTPLDARPQIGNSPHVLARPSGRRAMSSAVKNSLTALCSYLLRLPWGDQRQGFCRHCNF